MPVAVARFIENQADPEDGGERLVLRIETERDDVLCGRTVFVTKTVGAALALIEGSDELAALSAEEIGLLSGLNIMVDGAAIDAEMVPCVSGAAFGMLAQTAYAD